MIFSPTRLDAIRAAFNTRASKLFAVQEHLMADDDFIAAYIKPEHVAILNTTKEICGNIGGYSYGMRSTHLAYLVGPSKADVSMGFPGNSPIIIPQYVLEGPSDPDHPAVRALTDWLEERMRQGILLADAAEALPYLNTHCFDIRALRAVFPVIAVLVNDCAKGDDAKDPMRKLAARIQGNHSVTTLPRLPREVMQRLIQASELLNTTTLLEDDARAPRKTGFVSCSVDANSMKYIRQSLVDRDAKISLVI